MKVVWDRKVRNPKAQRSMSKHENQISKVYEVIRAFHPDWIQGLTKLSVSMILERIK